MPGKYEITRTISAIRASRVSNQFVALPLHGELPPAEQDAALAHLRSKRKAIVATNVAETSLTIEGVRVVIDSGLARIARFDPRRGINTLLIEKISRASADQRAGRAGRTAPGHCLRLWTEREHVERPAQELPEVKRLDLAEVVLTLKASGVEDIASFRWLEPPDPKALERAEQLLTDLGALSEGDGTITPLGRRMLAFPVHPRYARMLLAANDYGCVRAIALIAALTQGRNLLRRAESKQARSDRDDLFGDDAESDFFILMRAFRFAENNNFDPRRCAALSHQRGRRSRSRPALASNFSALHVRKVLMCKRKRARRARSRAACSPGFPTRWLLGWMWERCVVRWCTDAAGRSRARARCIRRNLLVASEIREIESSDRERQILLTLAHKDRRGMAA